MKRLCAVACCLCILAVAQNAPAPPAQSPAPASQSPNPNRKPVYSKEFHLAARKALLAMGHVVDTFYDSGKQFDARLILAQSAVDEMKLASSTQDDRADGTLISTELFLIEEDRKIYNDTGRQPTADHKKEISQCEKRLEQ